jgi:hypothetical protein
MQPSTMMVLLKHHFIIGLAYDYPISYIYFAFAMHPITVSLCISDPARIHSVTDTQLIMNKGCADAK